jgi:hypothetical protein
VAGIITISKGHDASYPWKQIGTEPDTEQAKRPKRHGVGYYLSPAERGGEPPGIWTGKDVAELGLEPGGIVDRKVFEPLYGHHLDPRDPTRQARLGRAPGNYKPADIIYETLLALEPHATAERREQLMIEAKAQVRTPDLYWDATFSVSKSISPFHASALANAAAATASGDQQAAAWEQVADRIWAAIMEGNAAALDYLQREAGQTRAGYRPGGRWDGDRRQPGADGHILLAAGREQACAGAHGGARREGGCRQRGQRFSNCSQWGEQSGRGREGGRRACRQLLYWRPRLSVQNCPPDRCPRSG